MAQQRVISRAASLALIAISLLAADARAAYKEPPSRMVGGYQLTPLAKFYFRASRFSAPVSFNRLIAPALVNGRATSLIVDTGAEGTMIDPHLIERLGLKPARQGKYMLGAAPNGVFSPILKASAISIGKVSSQDVLVVTAPSPWLVVLKGSGAGFTEAGLLGADYLKEHRAIIDCQRGELFLKANADAKNFAQATLEPHGWVAIPLKQVAENHLVAPIIIGEKRGTFLVDTGAPFSVLNRAAAQGMRISQSWRHFALAGIFTADRDAQIGRIKTMAIGNYQAANIELALTTAWERLFKAYDTPGSPCIGILGMDFLGNNLAFIDYGTRTLYLKRASAK